MRGVTVAIAAAGLAVALGGCGSSRLPEAAGPSTTTTTTTNTPPPFGVTMTNPPAGQSSPSSSEPPLSQIPPPTMTQPVPPPKTAVDSLSPLTLTGSAAKHAPTGCILLTTSGGTVDLVGPLAASTLAHPRVKVVAMPHPEIESPCGVTTMEVQSVVAVS